MRYALFVAGAVLVAGAVTAVTVAAVSRGNSSATTTLRLVEKPMSFHVIDQPPVSGPNRPPSQGDSFVFVSSLWTRGGQRAGTLRATCIVTQAGPPQALTCYGSFGLRGGQLEGIATVRGESNTAQIAIVGGTGAYVGARGFATSVTRGGGDNAPSDDTFRFTTQP